MIAALVFLAACIVAAVLLARWWVRRERRAVDPMALARAVGVAVTPSDAEYVDLDLLFAKADFEVDALALRTKPDAVLYEALTTP